MSKKVVIIGATAGIGSALAEIYAKKGDSLGISGRRLNLLKEIQQKYPNTSITIKEMDVAKVENSREKLEEIISEMGGMDICVINAGVGFQKATFEQQLQTLDINTRGFLGLANYAYEYFAKNGGGQLVGISSVAGVRGSGISPEYNASKAYMSSYLEGLQIRSKKRGHRIAVTDIRPGYVDTEMTKSNKQMFWVAAVEKAANQIYQAIETKKRVAYITKRWQFIAFLIKIMPNFIYDKMV